MTDPQARPRGILIAGNWKMNHGPAEAVRFFDELAKEASSRVSAQTVMAIQTGRLEVCVLPPSVSLEKAQQLSGKAPFRISVGSQNTHWAKSGAYTGEISAPMLQELGVSWSLAGH